MNKVTVKHHKGVIEHGQCTDFWSEEDWDNWNSYVEQCKYDGYFGEELESELFMIDDSLFSNEDKFVLDFKSVESFKFEPLIKS